MSLSANFPTTRPSLLLDFVNSGQMDPRITFSRASGAMWFNSAGTLIGVDASSSSLTVGTGQQTLTLAATAGVDRGWIVGTSVLLSASTVTNTMTGVVVSYTASTQVLVVNVASVVGSGTYATWQVSNLMPRLDYNPSTLAAQGLLIEEARTNSIRNNTMVGAVAGTPGTLPTNWSVSGLGTLTQQVVGTGTSNGITYIDLRFSGTTSTTQIRILSEIQNNIAASNGQSWALSYWTALVGGSLTNITGSGTTINLFDSTPTFLSVLTGPNLNTTASLTRVSAAGTIATVGTAFVQPQLFVNFNSGVAIDITLRIGLPQLELGAFATSVIPTTTTALTRAADVASVNTLSPWYNATEGTLYSESQQLAAQTAALFPRIVAIDDGATNNAIVHLWRADTSRLYANAVSSGSSQYDLGANGVTQTNVNKIASAFAANNFAASINGGSVLTDLAGVVPSGLTTLRIGKSSGTDFLNGYLRRITYYPRRLSNAELQAITT
jgi:hypothetical protein